MENPRIHLERAITPNLPASPERDYNLDFYRSFEILDNVDGVHPTRPDYATIDDINEAFDWNHVDKAVTRMFGSSEKRAVFVFHSKPNPINSGILGDADLLAFFEARSMKPDDFLYYFRGEPDEHENTLSFCVWTTPEAAVSVIGGKYHQEAAKLAKSSYVEANVEWFAMHRMGEGSSTILDPVSNSRHSLNVGTQQAP